MVTIGIIGVLFSISLPALLGARTRASELKSLTNARSIVSDMQAYADAKGTYPFVVIEPGGAAPVPIWPPGSMQILEQVWSLSWAWPGLVAEVAPWEEHYETWISPGRENVTLAYDTGFFTSYRYSTSFLASPALWSGSAATDESLIAPTRPTDVAHPSNKVLVWDGDLAYLPKAPVVVEGFKNHNTPMAFADGHAATHNPLDATPGVENPFNGTSDRLFNTPDGVRGRDY